jgi:sugar/nucleoside kinase (ribokinase family)
MEMQHINQKNLLLGPVAKDTIIRNNKTYRNIGGAVYYQSTALAYLGAEITAVVTISPDDQNLLTRFHSAVKINPVWTAHTMEFENKYPQNDNPNIRIQQAIIPENPILPEHLQEINIADYDAIYILPLCPHDIPLETIRYLALFDKPLFMGVQGYLRHLHEGKVMLKHWSDFEKFAPYITMLFADDNEAECIVHQHTNDLMLSARSIISCGIAEVVITQGNKGAVIATSKGEQYTIPAFAAARETYPTGLGDTYMAVYTRTRMRGFSPDKAGKWAAIAASMKLEYKGAFTGNLRKIEERMRIILRKWKQ